MDFSQIFVLAVVVFLVVSLYKEFFNPSLTFFIAVVALLVTGIITPAELLNGLSNQQIIIIFVLVLVTAGIRLVYGSDLFAGWFHHKLRPKAFLLRVMATSSVISPFINNTPFVALMIPYVRDWAEKTGNPSSKFMIPLSFATIMAGMITVIGTSTNLVLNGLIQEYHLPLLGFEDFFFLGVLVTVFGCAYLYFVGYKLLPSNPNRMDHLRENVKEYIIETEVFEKSKLIGKTIKEAGLRNLKDVFLVEIIRHEKVISPVSPEDVLEKGDVLFFAGNTQSIYKIIEEDNGLRIPKQDNLEREGQFNFVEAVIPANSNLIGLRIKESDFRKRFNASIIAIHRNGKKVSGKVGEMHLAGGDFLLLLAGEGNENRNGGVEKDLFYISSPKKITKSKSSHLKWVGVASLVLLILGIAEVLPLFQVCIGILTGLILLGVLSFTEIKRELDLSLLMILVCSLAIGVALEKSGTAELIAQGLIAAGNKLGVVGVLASLFLVTIFLTALISNTAAVSIVFPIAMSIAAQLQVSSTPFFVAIAFAASGDFMTPIGYQTNLMVYGPGGYTFKDFLRVGSPLTLLYVVICIVFISYYYNLV